ncbi:MAG TPA: EamA family transporter [Gaiellaceae bacterium]
MFAAMCVIWGIPYLLIRVAVRDLDPALLVFLRTTIAAAVLLPIAIARKELRPVLARWRPLVVFAAIEIAIPWLLLGSAERRLSSSFSGLMIAVVPLVGALIARERLGGWSVAGLVLGFGGVVALVGLDLSGTSALGLIEISGVILGYALGPIVLSRHLRDMPAMGVIAASLVVTMVVYAPVAAFDIPSKMPPAKVILSVITLALVCTALAFIVFFALIAEVGPVRATVITYVNPAVAAALGVGLLNEKFTAGMGIGFAMILGGSVLAARRPLERVDVASAGQRGLGAEA